MDFTVAEHEAGARLDRFVAEHGGVSRAAAIRLIEQGGVTVGPRRGKKGMVLCVGDVVHLSGTPVDDQAVAPLPQPELPLSVLYEDQDVVLVDKPVGWPCHPLRTGERGTVASALCARYPECATAGEHAREGGLCHRLDTFTSGVLLAARHRAAWQTLRAAFADEADPSSVDSRGASRIVKEYLALAYGQPLGESGRIDRPILPAPGRHDRVIVAPAGDDTLLYSSRGRAMSAETHFRVLRKGPQHVLLSVRMIGAGRRHQIRAHLSYLGLPLLGDTHYGGPPLPPELLAALPPELYEQAQGAFLHAARLSFPSPSDGHIIEVSAPLPKGRHFVADRLLSAI